MQVTTHKEKQKISEFDGLSKTAEQKVIEIENQLNPGDHLMKQKANMLKCQVQTSFKTKYKQK